MSKLTLVMDTEHLDTQHTKLFLDDKPIACLQGLCVEGRADVVDLNVSLFFNTSVVDANIAELGPVVQELQIAGVRVRFVK